MTKNNHLQFIDSLRGMAALNVVLFHLLLMPQPNLLANTWLKTQLMKGGTGVNLFFILSAFTLALSWDTRKSEKYQTLNYFLRRFFRIAPLFYFVMMISYTRDLFYYNHKPATKLVLAMVTFSYNLFPGLHESFVWAGWTIGIEMLFYLIFPLLVPLLHRPLVTIGCFIVSLGLSYLSSDYLFKDLGSYAYMNLLTQLPYFIFGILLYSLYVKNYLQRIPEKFTLFIGLTFGLSYWFILHSSFFPSLGIVWTCLIYALLFLYAMKSKLLNSSLALKKLGLYSYSIYLFHPIVIFLFFTKYPSVYRRLPVDLAYFACLTLVLLVLIPVAYMTWRWIETPGQNFGKKVIKRLSQEKTIS